MNPPPPLPPQNRKKNPPQNVSSILLTEQENICIFNLLGRKCVTLATGVVQVYLAQNPATTWQKKCTGVCCFVKDNPKRSYYIRVYSLQSEKLLWEQEIYTHFKYLLPKQYFFTFDTDKCRAALNFASEKEAFKFKQVVEEKMRHKQDRRAKSNRGTSARQPPSRPLPPSPNGSAAHQIQAPPPPMTAQPPSTTLDIKVPSSKESKKSSKKKKKGKLTKADISMPSGFKHVNHVGFDPNSGVYDMNAMDPDMQDIFKSVGMTEQDVKEDKEKVDFIYDFIEKRGGMQAVKNENQARKARDAPPPPPGRVQHNIGVAPPPPSRNSPGGHPPPHRAGKAPPPPNRAHVGKPGRGETPPPPPPSKRPAPPRQTAPSPSNAPPPPPPPPAPGPGVAPPPPPPAPSGGNFMAQIQQGADLRSVDRAPTPAPAPSGRDALLEAIRRGKDLKTVTSDPAEDKSPSPTSDSGGGLANALASALRIREQHIQGSDEEDGDEDDDSDEWDD